MAAREEEETFERKEKRTSVRNATKPYRMARFKPQRQPVYDSSKDSAVVSAVFYIVLGVSFALLLKQGLVYALQTDMPIVAVVSSSMEHSNPDVTHYAWLQNRFGYTREYVDSWPVRDGFYMGDMPVVQGTAEYGIGDVIVYSVPGQEVPIIHRIVKVNMDGTYQTKGDNNLNQLLYEVDVPKYNIHGKVVFVVPKLGYFKVLMTRAFGLP